MKVGKIRLARVKNDMSRIMDATRELSVDDPKFQIHARDAALQLAAAAFHIRQIADDVEVEQ